MKRYILIVVIALSLCSCSLIVVEHETRDEPDAGDGGIWVELTDGGDTWDEN